MFIESIELSDYRNYSHLHIDFHKGTNVLYGDNAQGKTNILEAVYVCSTTKSHRGSKDKEIIRFGADESHIKMMVRRSARCRSFCCKCLIRVAGGRSLPRRKGLQAAL